MFDDIELAGGKVKAFFDRVKVRDLYDISNLGRHFDDTGNDELVHRSMLLYASLSARFPLPFEGRSERFTDRQRELDDQLLPMLRDADEHPILKGLMSDAEEFIVRYIFPRTDAEAEYLHLFATGDFRPSLIFPDGTIAEAASKSPRRYGNCRT